MSSAMDIIADIFSKVLHFVDYGTVMNLLLAHPWIYQRRLKSEIQKLKSRFINQESIKSMTVAFGVDIYYYPNGYIEKISPFLSDYTMNGEISIKISDKYINGTFFTDATKGIIKTVDKDLYVGVNCTIVCEYTVMIAVLVNILYLGDDSHKDLTLISSRLRTPGTNAKFGELLCKNPALHTLSTTLDNHFCLDLSAKLSKFVKSDFSSVYCIYDTKDPRNVFKHTTKAFYSTVLAKFAASIGHKYTATDLNIIVMKCMEEIDVEPDMELLDSGDIAECEAIFREDPQADDKLFCL